MLGLVALAVSTIMLTIGQSVVVLIIGRLVQGISSAFVNCVGVVQEVEVEDHFRHLAD